MLSEDLFEEHYCHCRGWTPRLFHSKPDGMSDYKCDFFGQTVKHAMSIKTKDTGIFSLIVFWCMTSGNLSGNANQQYFAELKLSH